MYPAKLDVCSGLRGWVVKVVGLESLPLCPRLLWVRIPLRTLDSFMWGSYPGSLWNVCSPIQVPDRALNKAWRDRWGLPLPVKVKKSPCDWVAFSNEWIRNPLTWLKSTVNDHNHWCHRYFNVSNNNNKFVRGKRFRGNGLTHSATNAPGILINPYPANTESD